MNNRQEYFLGLERKDLLKALCQLNDEVNTYMTKKIKVIELTALKQLVFFIVTSLVIMSLYNIDTNGDKAVLTAFAMSALVSLAVAETLLIIRFIETVKKTTSTDSIDIDDIRYTPELYSTLLGFLESQESLIFVNTILNLEIKADELSIDVLEDTMTDEKNHAAKIINDINLSDKKTGLSELQENTIKKAAQNELDMIDYCAELLNNYKSTLKEN